ncbi:hypothetical protein [Alteribacter keqinensis]|uniref:Uncharacterized protein n=1 Tax=Alteribacter keqinensis TaxID=2483800 RepID=A0A3M7TNJ0_9BACI|nr:hypothetical protein [Alteribacter keqinensis]RNA66958.1 hypothetical protein EBO34_17325 [Alteribacter keqinensis]
MVKPAFRHGVIVGCLAFVLFYGINLLVGESGEIMQSFGMAGMIIEEKHHHIEPGDYTEMWIIGYNAYEKEANRERYKIFIEEAMVYNLIEEGEQYMVSASSIRKDEEYGYVYELLQIANQEQYQLTGSGRIK